jgi:hypothetical protein
MAGIMQPTDRTVNVTEPLVPMKGSGLAQVGCSPRAMTTLPVKWTQTTTSTM